MKKYIVELTSEERKQLKQIITKGKTVGYKIRHAQMLLKVDQGKQGPGWQDKRVAEAFGSHVTTVERLRKLFKEWSDEPESAGTTSRRTIHRSERLVQVSLPFL